MEKITIEDGNCITDHKGNQKLYELIGISAPINYDKCSIAVTRIEPRGQIIKHLHMKSEEIYIFTSGSATMKVNEKEFRVSTGDTALIYKNDIHELHTLDNESIEFYAITIPPFDPSDFVVI